METTRFQCVICEKDEKQCTCDRYCAICFGEDDARLCQDGCYYCRTCREACDNQPQNKPLKPPQLKVSQVSGVAVDMKQWNLKSPLFLYTRQTPSAARPRFHPPWRRPPPRT